MKGDALDPAGLIQQAYCIEKITAQDCRVIFLDWAIKSDAPDDLPAAIKLLLIQYADHPSDHPMTQTLLAGLADTPSPARRGGHMGRQLRG